MGRAALPGCGTNGSIGSLLLFLTTVVASLSSVCLLIGSSLHCHQTTSQTCSLAPARSNAHARRGRVTRLELCLARLSVLLARRRHKSTFQPPSISAARSSVGVVARTQACDTRLCAVGAQMSLLARNKNKAGSKSTSRAPAPAAPSLPFAPAAAPRSAELWVDKYAPRSSKELAMHKKKVDEVSEWLRLADASLQLGLPPTPRLLVLSGPSGAGKSAMLRVLAAEMGFEMCEWVEPRSLGRDLLWDDGCDSYDGGPRPDARAAAFATFLRDSLRTLSLCVTSGDGGAGAAGSSSGAASAMRRRLVVLDELAPSSSGGGDGGGGSSSGEGGGTQRDQQIALIRRSLLTARFPIALCVSTDSSNSVHHLLEALKGAEPRTQSLVSEIKVNALADSLLTKALQHVSAQERLDLASSEIASIVSAANGDLRNALHSMQFVATGLTRRVGAPSSSRTASRGAKRTLNGSSASSQPQSSASSAPSAAICGSDRDRFPDMFHAIGSIIHRPAKRAKLLAEHEATVAQEQRAPQQHVAHSVDGGSGGSGGSGSGSGGCPAAAGAAPTLASIDASWTAEGVIESSALEEPSAACFLHQNYVESYAEIDDLAEAAACLSDANMLVDAQRRRPWQTPLLPYVASLAGRGLVTHNRHPAPSRFMQTRKPQVFAIEREGLERKRRAASAFQRPQLDGTPEAGGVLRGGGIGSAALTSEVLPFLRLIIAQRGGGGHELTADQWQLLMELTSFGKPSGGLPPPPVYRRPSAAITAGAAQQASGSADAATALDDDPIEG